VHDVVRIDEASVGAARKAAAPIARIQGSTHGGGHRAALARGTQRRAVLLPLFGEALAADVGRRHGALVHMMHLRHGIFAWNPA
jgi:hypothetical protein